MTDLRSAPVPVSQRDGSPGTPARPRAPRLRAVEPLVMEMTGAEIVVSSPLLTRRLRVTPPVAQILIQARTGLDPAGHPPATIARLLEAGFLEEGDSPRAAQPPGPPWDAWGTTAWNFHRCTTDVPFISGSDPETAEPYLRQVSATPRPSAVRPPAADAILLLPRVRTPLDRPFREVLEGRRTHRQFEDRPVSLDVFADLLHYSFAPLRFADAGPMGVLQLRASASGGARHETEAFVFVFNVESVRAGLYHYDNIRHGLEPVSDDAGRDVAEHLTNDQGFFRNASFGVLTAAVARRMSWKYPHPVAFRMLLQNVGHVAQVFSMTAAASGLGAALTGAIRTSEAEGVLRLGPGELVTFALACGHPVLRPDGLPQAIRTPEIAYGFY